MPKLAKALTAPTVKKLRSRKYTYEKRDSKQDGLAVRVYPSGRKVWLCIWGRGRAKRIGDVSRVELVDARKEAGKIIKQVEKHGAPIGHAEGSGMTLGDFLQGRYRDWAGENLSNGLREARRVKYSFRSLASRPLEKVSGFEIEAVRRNRLNDGKAIATVNRETAQLRKAFNLAVEWHLISDNPMATVKQKKQDRQGRVRYLSVQERKRLTDALSKHPLWFRVLVQVALNTGLRRGELFNLRWRELGGNRLAVLGSGAKSGHTRFVALNKTAAAALDDWRKKSPYSQLEDHVFPNVDTGKRLVDIKRQWAALMANARISNFRFHDCRHDFASRLVMGGIDLYRVSELLGHASLNMTQKYAHLAPEHQQAAVAVLEN